MRAGKITEHPARQAHEARARRLPHRQGGFGSLRRDVHCESRPQSLIGEYFLDCLPGTARQALKPGARIPVAQTASTIAPDLVNDILREPSASGCGSSSRSSVRAWPGAGRSSTPRSAARARRCARRTRSSRCLGDQNRTLRTWPSTPTRSSATSPPTARTSGASSTKASDTAQASAERAARDRRGPAEAPRLPRAAAADDEVARRGRRPPDAGAAEPRRVGAADHETSSTGSGRSRRPRARRSARSARRR